MHVKQLINVSPAHDAWGKTKDTKSGVAKWQLVKFKVENNAGILSNLKTYQAYTCDMTFYILTTMYMNSA